MSDSELEQLAARLQRPAGSLAAFGRLQPEELALLIEAIDEARLRERQALEGGLPRPLRRLLLWLLGWKEP